MSKVTMDNVGQMIAHWNREPGIFDLEAVTRIVDRAIKACGVDAGFSYEYAKGECDSLGHGHITVTVKFNAAPAAVRRWRDCATLKGVDTVTVDFHRKAGLLDYEAYTERQKVEADLFEKHDKRLAMTKIDLLPWDGEVFEFTARTNGMTREYRHRHWYRYEGENHFQYADSWENLTVKFADYLGGVASDLGICFQKGEILRADCNERKEVA